MAKIGIVIEGVLNPKFKKGGLQGLISTLHALNELGHKSIVFSVWAEGISKNDAQELYPKADFQRIQQKKIPGSRQNGKIPNNIYQLRNELAEQIANSNVECLVLNGFGSIEALKNRTKLPSIALIGLPNDRLALANLKLALAEPNNSLLRRAQIVKSSVGTYLIASWRLWRMRKSVDVILAADPNNARRHSFIARKGYLHFPNPARDNAIPKKERPPCDNTILFVNAWGTHSLASQLYFTREILPHLDKLERYDYLIKIVGMDKLPTFMNIPDNLAKRIIVQPYTDPLEPELYKSACLLMCSPLPYGASMRVKTAMMCGTACIVHSAVTIGLPELIDNENCLVASTGQVFVKHIKRLLIDMTLRERLSDNARRTYERHFIPASIIPVLKKAFCKVGLE